jgi:hypothetical protein
MTSLVMASKFFSIVAAASASNSTALRTSNPARSTPRSIPPAPAKRLMAVPIVRSGMRSFSVVGHNISRILPRR